MHEGLGERHNEKCEHFLWFKPRELCVKLPGTGQAALPRRQPLFALVLAACGRGARKMGAAELPAPSPSSSAPAKRKGSRPLALLLAGTTGTKTAGTAGGGNVHSRNPYDSVALRALEQSQRRRGAVPSQAQASRSMASCTGITAAPQSPRRQAAQHLHS